jgi:hypothetical protein
MKLTFEPARLTGFAILAVASATALSVGACSSSHDEKPPAKSSAPASAKGKDSVHGLIASVSGNSVQVTQTTGTATVDVSASTEVEEFSKAQLTDIAAGNCVSAISSSVPPPGGPVAAANVQLTPQGGDGKCPQPKTGPRKVVGTVASVAGDTIHLTFTDAHGNPAQTDVTVTDKTNYTKQAPVTSQAIAQGKCITAHGTKDGGGTLQAKVVALGPAHGGQCPQPAVKQQPH